MPNATHPAAVADAVSAFETTVQAPADVINEPAAEPIPEPVVEAGSLPVAPAAAPELTATPQGYAEASPYGYDDWMAAVTTGPVDDAVTETPTIAEAAAAIDSGKAKSVLRHLAETSQAGGQS